MHWRSTGETLDPQADVIPKESGVAIAGMRLVIVEKEGLMVLEELWRPVAG